MNVLVTIEDARRFEQRLGDMKDRAVPHAVRDALNEMAFLARSEWVENVKAKMILRNRFTEKSIRVDKARGTRLDTMQVTIGSVADYMDEQEDGGRKSKRGKHGLAIPTPSAAGQGLKARPRKRVIRRQFYLGSMSVAPRVSGPSYKKNAAAIAIAQRTGKAAYLETKTTKGLFRVMGTAKRPKVRMIYNLDTSSVEIPQNPTLGPAVTEVTHMAPAITVAAMQRQIDRIFAKP